MSVESGIRLPMTRLWLSAAIFLFASSPWARAADPEIRLSLKDHKFVPEEVSAPAGQKIKFIVLNEESAVCEFESVDFHREKIVQPGKEVTVYVGPLEAGTYEFFDDFHPGVRGRLLVK